MLFIRNPNRIEWLFVTRILFVFCSNQLYALEMKSTIDGQ